MKDKLLHIFKNTNQKNILKNICWLFFDKILKMLLGVFVIIMLSRYLEPKEFGLLNYIISLVSLFIAISALGLNSIVVRDLINKQNINKTLGSSFLLRFVGGVLAMLILVLTINILRPNDEASKYLVIVFGFSIVFRSSDIIKFWYESRTDSKKTAFIESSVFIVSSIFKIWMIFLKAPLEIFVYILLIESVLNFILFFLIYNNDTHSLFLWEFSLDRSKKLLKDSWPLIISSAAWIIYSKIDQIMIGQMLGDEEVGYYSAATRLSEVVSFIPAIITFSIVPTILKYRISDRKKYDDNFQKIYYIVTTILFSIAVIITLFSDTIIMLIYGENYMRAVGVLGIQFWIVVFTGLATVSGRYLVNDNNQKVTMTRHLLGVIINIPLNLILIPFYNIEGAAWASLISLIIVNYLFDYFFIKTRFIFIQKTKAIFQFWLYIKK